jgi:hypothetical protein
LRRVGSIGANRANRLGRGRSCDSVPHRIESDARAARTIQSRGWARGRTRTIDSVGGQLAGLGDGPPR